MRRNDLGRWHHGASNDVECQEEDCDFLAAGVSDATALRLARKHGRDAHHTVEVARTSFRYVYPPGRVGTDGRPVA
jgi:hypothetical protein